jgi:Ca-activated chloride channel family protein
VPVFTVALGTPDGIIESQGETVPVPVEVEQLQEIADVSGGAAYVAGDADTLSAVYEDLGSSLGFTFERQDVTSKYVGYLVLLGLISSAGGIFVATRWP